MSITLIAGLGNPGSSYVETRHNAGFWFLDQLAQQANQSFNSNNKFHGDICKINSYWLLKPNTFMNLSGKAIAALANFYKIPAEQILVVHDELDFPAGTIRLKKGGGDGLHNGLKDIIAKLGSRNFLRLRIGIGHPGHSSKVTNYVLNKPTTDDQIAIDLAINSALKQMPLIMAGELNQAMQLLHSQ